ncbi:MAG: hypothetical protein RR645_02525, partial [Clostridium sp.]
ITYLLNLQQKNTSGGFIRSLFLCTIISSLISLLFIGDFRIMNVIIYGLILVFTLVIDYSFRGYLNHNKEEVVIGLLNDDSRLLDHLRQLASQSENSNKILINIRIENELEKKYIAKWNDSRGFIIGKEINYILLNKTFITVVDLTNRDIKYSKISILADLICYIGEKGKLTDINAMWVD